MFINSSHISLYDISLTQNILYKIKRDLAVWKGLGCPQPNQRTWWQIVATPYTMYTGLAELCLLMAWRKFNKWYTTTSITIIFIYVVFCNGFPIQNLPYTVAYGPFHWCTFHHMSSLVEIWFCCNYISAYDITTNYSTKVQLSCQVWICIMIT